MNLQIIQGPAYILLGSKTWYTEGDVIVNYPTESWSPMSAMFGSLGSRLSSRHAVISFTPAGAVTAATATSKHLTYSCANVGDPICTEILEICPKTGNKITWAKAGISKMPSLRCSATATIWGAMEIIAVGDYAKLPTAVDFWQAIVATTVATEKFDGSQVISPRYVANYDALSAIEPDENGFMIEPETAVAPMPRAANYGVVQFVLSSIAVSCRFKPLSLTEAEVASLCHLQDATAHRPGDSALGSDLVIKDGALVPTLTITLKNMAPFDLGYGFGTAIWRQGEVTFRNNSVTFVTGVPAALWTFV